MKKLLLLTLAVVATSIMANADTLTFNCTPFPATFTAGAGSSPVSCPALTGVTPTGLTSVTLNYFVDYQFGNPTGNSGVNVTFSATNPGGVTWNLATTIVNSTGGQSSPGIQTGSAVTTAGATLAAFASAFNVGVSSAVSAGTVATSSGAVSVTYNYTTAAPEPATISLIGLSLVGLGALSRRRSS
jgi:PEP-CTERM motif